MRPPTFADRLSSIRVRRLREAAIALQGAMSEATKAGALSGSGAEIGALRAVEPSVREGCAELARAYELAGRPNQLAAATVAIEGFLADARALYHADVAWGGSAGEVYRREFDKLAENALAEAREQMAGLTAPRPEPWYRNATVTAIIGAVAGALATVIAGKIAGGVP